MRAHLKPRYQTACKNQDHACTATAITGVRPRGRAGAWRVTRGRSKGPYLPLIRCTVLNLGRVQRSYRPFVAYNLKVFQHGRTVIVNRCARASRSRRAGPLACPWLAPRGGCLDCRSLQVHFDLPGQCVSITHGHAPCCTRVRVRGKCPLGAYQSEAYVHASRHLVLYVSSTPNEFTVVRW